MWDCYGVILERITTTFRRITPHQCLTCAKHLRHIQSKFVQSFQSFTLICD